MNILSTLDLTKNYSGTQAVSRMSLTIKRGEIFGLVGENGSGKTTLIRLISKLTLPSNGGFTLTFSSTTPTLGAVGAIVESPAFYPRLSAQKTLIHQAMLLGVKINSDELLSLVGLEYLIGSNKPVRSFSLGMRQRLAIALALVGDPELVILDEPMNGLDPSGIKIVRELIIRLNKEQGITFLISSHQLEELQKIATSYGFISRGRLIQEIGVEQLHEEIKLRWLIGVDDANRAVALASSHFPSSQFFLINDNTLVVYDPPEVNDFFLLLNQNNLPIVSFKIIEPSVVDYYFSLLRRVQNG